MELGKFIAVAYWLAVIWASFALAGCTLNGPLHEAQDIQGAALRQPLHAGPTPPREGFPTHAKPGPDGQRPDY